MRTLLLNFLLATAAFAADITGSWIFNVETQAGTGNPTFKFEQKGEQLTGAYQGALGDAKLTGTVKGDKLEFQFEVSTGGQTMKVEYKGTIESSTKMKGTGKYDQLGEATWTATKQ